MDKRLNISFRTTYIVLSFIAICIACIVSLSIVLLLLHVFYRGPITLLVVAFSGLLICILTIIFGGIILWRTSDWFSKPIVAIDHAVNKVASGDFDASVEVDLLKMGKYEISNELTTLINNFNKMTLELNRMEYMSRDFMSNVSHEIKTPVATVTGITEMLMDGGLDADEQEEYFEIVHEASERISTLCNSMLQISKLDHQQIIEKNDEIRLDEQIRKAVIKVTETYSEISHEVDLSLEEITYTCNENLMMQVWINLIDNAFKYSTPESTISVSVEKITNNHADEPVTIRVMIHNEGERLAEEKLERMFDRFYQCDISHKDKGNGLGLSIVSRIVELHGGRIHCESGVGKGVSMYVELDNIVN